MLIKSRNLFLMVLEPEKSKIKVSVYWMTGEGLFWFIDGVFLWAKGLSQFFFLTVLILFMSTPPS